MTEIKTDDKITYQHLVDNVINKIIAQCINIDDKYNSVFKNKETKTYQHLWNDHHYETEVTANTKGLVTNESETFVPTPVVATISHVFSNPLDTQVKSDVVRSQFQSFLESRGIANKSNTVMTTKGILNFAANAAAFIKARVVTIANEQNKNVTATLYNGSNDTSVIKYAAITSENTVDATNFSKVYVQQMADALNHTDRFQNLIYNVVMPEKVDGRTNCSSSSSSSSCSSSSSSSSSSCSSSFFIAYMRL